MRGSAAGRGVPLHVTSAAVAMLDRWRAVRDGIIDALFAGVPAGVRQALVDGMAAGLLAQQRRNSVEAPITSGA